MYRRALYAQDSLAPMASASQLADKATNRLYNPYDGLNSRIDPVSATLIFAQ